MVSLILNIYAYSVGEPLSYTDPLVFGLSERLNMGPLGNVGRNLFIPCRYWKRREPELARQASTDRKRTAASAQQHKR